MCFLKNFVCFFFKRIEETMYHNLTKKIIIIARISKTLYRFINHFQKAKKKLNQLSLRALNEL